MVRFGIHNSMRPTVAIVDPDATTRQSLQSLLGALDVEVRTFDSGESFLSQSQRDGRALTCVIADVCLPGMSGIELLQRIRANDADLPVVLLASEAEVQMAVEAMRLGATDFIEKPQLDVALLRRVSQLLRNGMDVDTSAQARHTSNAN